MWRMRPVLALLVMTASLWGGAAAGGGVEITVHSEPLYAGSSRALPLGFHTLEADGAVASARVPSGLRATFYELASGDGAHVLIEAGQSVPDFSSSGFSHSPLAVLVELEEGAVLFKDNGYRWVHFSVGLHDLRFHAMFAAGAESLRLSPLVSVTLFEGPGCSGRTRIVTDDVARLDDMAVDEDDPTDASFGARLACLRIERRFGAVMYSKPFFQGAHAYFGPGKHGRVAALLPPGEPIASVRVQEHVRVRLFSEVYYAGHYVDLAGSLAHVALTGQQAVSSANITVQCLRPCIHGDCDTAPDYCKCKRGWFGDACDEFRCDPECVHGTCSLENRGCTCENGWGGRDCSLAFCPSGCHHGSCIAPNKCQCKQGFTGVRCDRQVQQCGDGRCIASHNETCQSCPRDCGECPNPRTRAAGGRSGGGSTSSAAVKDEARRRQLVSQAAEVDDADIAAVMALLGVAVIIVLAVTACMLNAFALWRARKAAARAAQRDKRE